LIASKPRADPKREDENFMKANFKRFVVQVATREIRPSMQNTIEERKQGLATLSSVKELRKTTREDDSEEREQNTSQVNSENDSDMEEL